MAKTTPFDYKFPLTISLGVHLSELASFLAEYLVLSEASQQAVELNPFVAKVQLKYPLEAITLHPEGDDVMKAFLSSFVPADLESLFKPLLQLRAQSVGSSNEPVLAFEDVFHVDIHEPREVKLFKAIQSHLAAKAKDWISLGHMVRFDKTARERENQRSKGRAATLIKELKQLGYTVVSGPTDVKVK